MERETTTLRGQGQKNHVRAHFDRQAEDYSQRREGAYSFSVQKRIGLHFLSGIEGRVLDLGCGGGYLTADLLAAEFVEVWGADLSKAMLALAQTRAGGQGVTERTHFVVGDAERLPLAAGSFDAVVCMGLIEYLPDYVPALQEMNRLLKPGGMAVISVPTRVSPHYLAQRLASACRQALIPLISRNNRRVKAAYKVNYVIPWRFNRILADQGFREIEAAYCNFIFFPIDRLFPAFSVALSRKLERFSRFPFLEWWGRQYVVKAVKV